MNTIENGAAARAGCRSARPRLRIRGTMLAVNLAVGTGVALSWGLLSTVELAPFVLGAMPCVAACALGLCAGAKSQPSHYVRKDAQ